LRGNRFSGHSLIIHALENRGASLN
jgi:hypothetical protein